MIFTPKITLASPISFVSNYEARNLLVLCTTSRVVPKISISSTYNGMITHSRSVHFVYTHLSTSTDKNPLFNKALLNFSCHCLGACFRPYKDLCNLKILFSCHGVIHPSGYNMYISSSESPFKKVVLTSI